MFSLSEMYILLWELVPIWPGTRHYELIPLALEQIAESKVNGRHVSCFCLLLDLSKPLVWLTLSNPMARGRQSLAAAFLNLPPPLPSVELNMYVGSNARNPSKVLLICHCMNVLTMSST